MPWIEDPDDPTGETLINLDELDDEDGGPDMDFTLACGCLVGWNHGNWDPDVSDICASHTFTQAVRIAESPLPRKP